MNSRERVHAALRKQPVDRVPIFMWFHPDTVARLAAMLRIPPARVGEVTGNDIRQAWVNNNYACNWFFGQPRTVYSRGRRGPTEA